MGSSQAEKRQTHVKLVDVAAQRFREGGLARLSVADLMAEAGLSHGGFYKHFASRDVLVTEAVEAALANGASLVEPGSTKRSFEDLMRSYLGVAHRDDRGAAAPLQRSLQRPSMLPRQRGRCTRGMSRTTSRLCRPCSHARAGTGARQASSRLPPWSGRSALRGRDKTRVAAMEPGPTGMHPWLDVLSRLPRAPVASIAEIRGRARPR